MCYRDGSNVSVTEFREGSGRQPQGYTKMTPISFFEMCFWCHFVSVGCHCFWHVFPLPISQEQVAAWFLSSYWTWQGLGDCGGVVNKAHWWSQRCGGHAHPLPHWQQHLRFHVNRCGCTHHAASPDERRDPTRKIQVWKSRTVPLPKTSDALRGWSRGVQVFPWRSLLARCVLAIAATSASLSAFFLLRVKQWPRSGAVYEAITLRNACIYMRPEGPRDGFVFSAGLCFFSLTFKCQKGGSVVKLHLFDVE